MFVFSDQGAPCSSLQASCCLCLILTWGGLFLSLEEMILENQTALLDSSSSQDHPPWASSKQTPEYAKVSSLEIQGCDAAFCLVPLSQDPELRHLVVTAVKAAPSFHIHDPFFLACKQQVQQNISHHWPLDHLCQVLSDLKDSWLPEHGNSGFQHSSEFAVMSLLVSGAEFTATVTAKPRALLLRSFFWLEPHFSNSVSQSKIKIFFPLLC